MDKYDVAIIGAGIAGSTLAILLAQQGKNVIVFEKENYPKHKVCGEFVSMESYSFFQSLGLPMEDWNLPIITNLKLTSEKGTVLRSSMETGGFGISRYKLDQALVNLMEDNGVTVLLDTKVSQVTDNRVSFSSHAIKADLIIGAHGKYSPGYTLDKIDKRGKNYIGVKYHIKGDFIADEIVLHSFDGGYCGMSQIEDDKYCLCYLIEAEKLKANGNNIAEMEKKVLFNNSHLKEVLRKAKFLWDKPLVISNVKFDKKRTEQNSILFCGDAAGSISPLSGNGMTIAAKSALILSQLIDKDLNHSQLMFNYNKHWNRQFGSKISKAKLLNRIMLNPKTHDLVLKLLKNIKPLRIKVINDMQGKPFVRSTDLLR